MYYQKRLVRFVSILENIAVNTDLKAVVVVNERTGTVVMGADVRIRTVAISHGDLSLEVKPEVAAPTPEEEEAQKDKKGDEDEEAAPKEEEVIQHHLNVVEEGASIGAVVKALNELGVKPHDLIIILQTLKAAGALQAELRFI